MLSCDPCIHKTVPEEYRHIAEALFPPKGFCTDQGPSIEAARGFADILGIGADYMRLLENLSDPRKPCGEIRHFLKHFQNNLDLLIQKTWVEKADEARKEQLQDRIPGFIAEIEREQYPQALADFSLILEELAYLFFGAQSRKEDFTEYTFRIDTQMGLFWWYGQQIGGLQQTGCCIQTQNCEARASCLKAVLFLGICYLTNF
ncbi:MAG: hypothetical protein LBG73_09905 [Spirochaetaceae bacterium]|jgi:hypothetical protein|nr:hypothetical protein [Spirochaetaceae bacterium]